MFPLLPIDTTVTLSTGRWRSSAPVESTLTPTTARAPTTTSRRRLGTRTDTIPTGRRSTGRRPAVLARHATSAPLMTLARHWATAPPSTTRRTTKARRSRCGAAGRHNRSFPRAQPSLQLSSHWACLAAEAAAVASIDSQTHEMPYGDGGRQCTEHCVSVCSVCVCVALSTSQRCATFITETCGVGEWRRQQIKMHIFVFKRL